MSKFDQFSSAVASQVAKARFFIFCAALVLIWLPSILVIRNVDTWQLIINTITTIFTFLMMALLHNDQQRFEEATNESTDSLARALLVLIKMQQVPNRMTKEVRTVVQELEKSIGLNNKISS